MNIQPDKHCNENNPAMRIDVGFTNETADAIVDELVFASDAKVATPVPAYDNVVDLIVRLKGIVYPVFCAVEHSREVVRERLRTEVADVGEALVSLIRRCILRDAQACVEMKRKGCEESEAIERSHQTSTKRFSVIRDSALSRSIGWLTSCTCWTFHFCRG